MRNNENEDTTSYNVVINEEEQYSIWPVHRKNPMGWQWQCLLEESK